MWEQCPQKPNTRLDNTKMASFVIFIVIYDKSGKEENVREEKRCLRTYANLLCRMDMKIVACEFIYILFGQSRRKAYVEEFQIWRIRC